MALTEHLDKDLVFFVVLACHLSVLDWFDQHFQATVHYTLTSDIV